MSECETPIVVDTDPWQPIETAPMDQRVLLGWWREWPDSEWVAEVALAGASNTKPPGMSNAWLHGMATHWMPLPAPPSTARDMKPAGYPHAFLGSVK